MVSVHVSTFPVTERVAGAQVSLFDDGAGVTDVATSPKSIAAPDDEPVTLMLNLWGTPTGFTAEGVISMAASTHSLRRLSSSVAPETAVVRFRITPRTL